MNTKTMTTALLLAVLGGWIVMTADGEALAGQNEQATGFEQATLGGGCFWCIEAVYEELDGVIKAESGYAGGRTANPTYEEICSGASGHAEVVQITYDPTVISYAEILMVFFSVHDPTTLDRQGADVGTQYRSVIFAHDEEQLRIAEAALHAVRESDLWENKAVTEVTGLPRFVRAEQYHQDYYARNRTQGYCQAVINPKLAKFRKDFAERLKE